MHTWVPGDLTGTHLEGVLLVLSVPSSAWAVSFLAPADASWPIKMVSGGSSMSTDAFIFHRDNIARK